MTAINLQRPLANWLGCTHTSLVTGGCQGDTNQSLGLCDWELTDTDILTSTTSHYVNKKHKQLNIYKQTSETSVKINMLSSKELVHMVGPILELYLSRNLIATLFHPFTVSVT